LYFLLSAEGGEQGSNRSPGGGEAQGWGQIEKGPKDEAPPFQARVGQGQPWLLLAVFVEKEKI
jgi:hypothetical protein